MKGKILILGKTITGETFRPQSWCDRIAGLASSIDSLKRIYYHSYLYPVYINNEGTRGLAVDSRLANLDPELYNFVMRFAESNELIVHSDDSQETYKEAV